MRDTSPTIYKQKLGEALVKAREAADVQREEAARTLGCSVSKIRTIEKGEVSIRPSELRDLLDLYDVSGDERADIEHLADIARQRRPRTPWGGAVPDRLRRFFDLEETAAAIHAYSPWLLQGLAQTEQYARAVIATNSSLAPDDVDRLVQARLARQVRLNSERPPAIHWVIDEHVLRMPVGGREVMRGQLAHLAAIGRKGVGELRVIPTQVGAHAGCGIPFLVLTDDDGKRAIYVETLTDGRFVDDAERVERYENAMREMTAVALSHDESLSLVDTVLSDL